MMFHNHWIGTWFQSSIKEKVWPTVYKEQSLPKMLGGTAYSCSLRACLYTDTALHFALLSSNDHSQESKENYISEPII